MIFNFGRRDKSKELLGLRQPPPPTFLLSCGPEILNCGADTVEDEVSQKERRNAQNKHGSQNPEDGESAELEQG